MESIFIGDVYRQRAFNAFNYTQDFIVPRMDLPRIFPSKEKKKKKTTQFLFFFFFFLNISSGYTR